MMASQSMEENMHIVYHHTSPGMCKTDFRGTWTECMDWIKASGAPLMYYMRAVK